MSNPDWVSISDASDWPPEVTSLSRLLASRIPLELADGTCNLASLRSSELLGELATLFESSPGVFSDTHCNSQVLSVLDLILSTVASLRALSEMSIYDVARPTTPFWTLLLRSLLINCYDKSYILENVSFALPKLPESKCVVLDGQASLLASHLANTFQPLSDEIASQITDDPSPMTEDGEESHHDGSGCSLSDGEESLSEQSDEDSCYGSTDISTEPTSAPLSNIPVEAHVLSHWLRPDCAALPFLCVADRRNIIPLIQSTVYQRYTWGISEPVVGVILSETGCIGRVVMGWIEQHGDADHLLKPRVTVAYSDQHRPNSSLGIYDLTDPVSTIQLAQFVLSLRQHVESIVSESLNPTFKPILWRSDSIQLDEDQSDLGEQGERRIRIWLCGVPSPQDGSASESIDPFPTSEIAKMSVPSKSSKRAASAKMSSQSSLNPPVEGKQRHTSHGTSTMSGASTRAKAASAMAKVPEAGIADGDPLSIGSFLYDRHAFSVARLPLTDATAMDVRRSMEKEDGPTLSYKDNDTVITAAQNEEVTAMVRIYDDLTEYQKPSWVTPPSVDKAVKPILDLIMRQVVDMDSTAPEYSTLDPSLMKIVTESLSFLLCVSVGGFGKGLDYKPNETEARHCWDFLLYISFVVQGDIISQRVLLEKLLALSRNIALDLASGTTNADSSAEEQANVFVQLCSRAFKIAESRYGIRDPVCTQAADALADAFHYRQQVVDLMTAPNVAEIIKERAKDEPDNAKCDAFLAFPLSIPKSIPKHNRPIDLVCGWHRLKPPSPADQDPQTNLPPRVEERHPETPRTEAGRQQTKSPFFTNASETKAFKITQKDLERIVENLLGKHLLSVFVGEYKRPEEEAGKAVNQCKIYLVSAVMHLKSLGITRYPVFGLATNGASGALMCCWYSQRLDRVFIMDRNIRIFDISSPIQTYHFMTFLLRLRRWSDEQLQKHQDRISVNPDAFQPDHFWTRNAQNGPAKKGSSSDVHVSGIDEIDEDAEGMARTFAKMKV
ncbi:uncharacterized protein BT62DRAFT_1077605 [Guyanagaster necrorhizus]|uniref:Uncharacterized protein n=1 Tax=Guyanagaster necrorhizus TaxID=856835 RepID=A0A9P7VRY3_9AGAR|nr:uncharacterized protein BT62DRAFT_1077605 [Guyanagaster necrorhizus MCA 3950]KAG7444854.1 hypothetical protein BT62DRAFT_1077605 [Guyanagaster necrorhizus MCA 3950]